MRKSKINSRIIIGSLLSEKLSQTFSRLSPSFCHYFSQNETTSFWRIKLLRNFAKILLFASLYIKQSYRNSHSYEILYWLRIEGKLWEEKTCEKIKPFTELVNGAGKLLTKTCHDFLLVRTNCYSNSWHEMCRTWHN